MFTGLQAAFRRSDIKRPEYDEMVNVWRILYGTGLKTVICQTVKGHIGLNYDRNEKTLPASRVKNYSLLLSWQERKQNCDRTLLQFERFGIGMMSE